jgi:phenylalanyl-tRNA synthetase beta chain
MGTHDLDKIKGPITYEAVSPAEIKFQALKQTESMSADKLCELYKTDNVMKKFLPILEGHDKFPVFFDADREVLSLPPLINSNRTKITCNTKHVFVEITATDLQKAKICLAIMAAQFSTHSAGEWQHKCEQVQITYENTPDMGKELSPTLTY